MSFNRANLLPSAASRIQKTYWLESLLFALLFCGYPVVSFLPEFLPLPDRAASVGFRALCLGMSFWVVVRGRWNLRRADRSLILVVCFWVGYLLRVIYDYYFSGAVGRWEFREYMAYTYGISCASMVAMFFVRDWRNLRYAPPICMVLSAFACILAIKYGVSSAELETIGRLAANERLNPISLGHTATTLILTSLWYLLRREKDVKKEELSVRELQQDTFFKLIGRVFRVVRTPLLVLAVAVGLYALGLSASRGPTLALLVSLGLIAFWLKGRVVYLVVLSIGAVATFLQLDFLSQLSSMGVSINRVMSMGLQMEDYGGGGRTDLYTEAWNFFMANPITGSALFLQNGSYPHNLILEIMMSMGLVGCISFFTILYWALRNLITQSKGNPLVFWIFLLFGQAFTGAMTSGAIYYDPAMWGVLGLGISLAATSNRKDSKVMQPRMRSDRAPRSILKGRS